MSAFGGKADMETGWRQDKLCVQTTMSTRCRRASHLDVRFGSKGDSGSEKRNVRFTPESDIKCDIMECPLWADSGHRDTYSMPSSDVASSDCGILRPPHAAIPPVSQTNPVIPRQDL